MSAFNWFTTRKKAFDLRTVAVSAAYTARLGSVANNFIIDRVINVSDPAANIAITIPNGTYEGQQLLVNLLSDTNSKTTTVTTTTGSDYALTTAGDYASIEWTNATTGWIASHELTT